MKKLIFLIGFIIVVLQQLSGQVPQKFSYQAVLRNADGTVIANQTVSIKITLHEKESTGTVVYTEEHSVVINNGQGIVSIFIGGGAVLSGTFATIPWSESIFMQVDVKKADQITYQTIGTSQILSVPYALAAGNVKEVKPQPGAIDGDPIFAVRNSKNEIVFAVYENGATVNIAKGAKGAKGGFAVGGLTSKSNVAGLNFLNITTDSTRIYIDDFPTGKGAKGGFAVGGLTGQGKSVGKDYFKVTPDTSFFSTNIFTTSNIISTGNISSGGGIASAPVTDIEGNIYQTVKIGTQTWMKENLKTRKYSDGTPIDPMSVQAYNNTSNIDTVNNYGLLYTSSAAISNQTLNVCPDMWHIPNQNEWDSLMIYVGGPYWSISPIITGLKLMEPGVTTDLTGFWDKNLYPNNASGFSARPAGSGSPSTTWFFYNIGSIAEWWVQGNGQGVMLDGNTGEVRYTAASINAFSIRCIKGAPMPSK